MPRETSGGRRGRNTGLPTPSGFQAKSRARVRRAELFLITCIMRYRFRCGEFAIAALSSHLWPPVHYLRHSTTAAESYRCNRIADSRDQPVIRGIEPAIQLVRDRI